MDWSCLVQDVAGVSTLSMAPDGKSRFICTICQLEVLNPMLLLLYLQARHAKLYIRSVLTLNVSILCTSATPQQLTHDGQK